MSRLSGPSFVLLAAITAPAAATDISVDQVRIQHAIQSGGSRLVAGRTGWVRVKVDTGGGSEIVEGVDAILHVFLDGAEIPGSPFRSLNGPIEALPDPDWALSRTTINFPLLVPSAGEVTLVIDLNPWGAIPETDFSNNVAVVNGIQFVCRELADIAYIPINYTLGGGLPDEGLTKPGVGDNSVQAIFGSGGIRYHRAAVPPLVWNININNSMSQLLGALQDIRLNVIPATGAPRPDLLYGWLAGNPYFGNGAAISIPGDVAAGNTAPERFQRTFAHEVGHLVGRSHVTSTVNTVGVDVDHHLLVTELLPQIVPEGKFDVMVAGKLTKEAWVNNASWHAFIDDSRFACDGAPPPGEGENAADDAPTMAVRIAGLLDHDAALLAFRPIMPVWDVELTPDDPAGDTRLEILLGERIVHTVCVRTATAREVCAPAHGAPQLLPDSWFSVIVPAALLADGTSDAIRAVRIDDGAILGERWRSETRPVIEAVGVSVAPIPALERDRAPDPEAPVDPEELASSMMEVVWSAADLDGDTMVANLLYTHDGARWIPLAINDVSGRVAMPSGSIPAAKEGQGRIRLVVSDGFDWAIDEFPIAGAVGIGNTPEVQLVTPNDGSVHLEHAPIILHAAAWDWEDGLLPDAAVSWTSDLDGPLAFGRVLLHAGLSTGTHELTVSAVDTDGMIGSDSIVVIVKPRTNGPDINADGVVDGADLGLLLAAWGTCTGCGADINADGSVDGLDLGVLLAAWSTD